jgi:peptide chain release factor subunit 1
VTSAGRRALAELEPGELPVLSIYLDMRPHATGENPAVRARIVILRNRLREIEKTYLPRGAELDSIRRDADRIQRYLNDEYDVAADGLALFACAGRGLFETVEAGVPFEDQVTVGLQPDLFQLARLVDEHETAGWSRSTPTPRASSSPAAVFFARLAGLMRTPSTSARVPWWEV